MRSSAGAGAGDDIEFAITIEVGCRDAHPAREERTVSVELADEGAIRDDGVGLKLIEFGALDDLDVWSSACTRAGDDFRHPAARAPKGHEGAARERGVVSIELAEESSIQDFIVGVHHVELAAIDYLDMGPTAG